MSRRVQLQVLCEDVQHEAFVRRFLELRGWKRRAIRVDRAPPGEGAAEAWVRAQYPSFVAEIRRKRVARALIVVIDGDAGTVAGHITELDEALVAKFQATRQQGEPIMIVVPLRNIETWLAYLGGVEVDERLAYPHLARERECAPAVAELQRLCASGQLRSPAPSSLEQACVEWKRIPVP